MNLQSAERDCGGLHSPDTYLFLAGCGFNGGADRFGSYTGFTPLADLSIRLKIFTLSTEESIKIENEKQSN